VLCVSYLPAYTHHHHHHLIVMEKSVPAWVLAAVAISLLVAPPRSLPTISAADAFAHPWGVFPHQQQRQMRIQHLNDAKTNDSFLDVEFEKVKRKEKETATTKQESSQQLSSWSSTGKSLLELSLDMDPQWKEARIPFCYDDRYIDCHVAFTVDLDGTTTYGIGVPCDDAVAIVLERYHDDDDSSNANKVTYMNPALEEHDELVQIMAAQLQELLGDDVFLKRTPKILTVSGNLNKYTEHWKDDLFHETVSTNDLMDDSDEGLDFFYDFMKSQLGETEFQKSLEECRQDNTNNNNTEHPVANQELLDLFNIPGLGNQQDDVDGLEKMLQELTSSKDISESESFTKLGEDLEHEGVALKLFGFNFRDGKSYSLVKLLKPFTIVGKYVDNTDKDDLRFDLLTPQEEAIVIPRLEQICKADLEQSGLSLQ